MPETTLRAYMAYDYYAGPEEGAALVFAATAKDARRLAWPTLREWFGGEWINCAVRWLRADCAHLRRMDGPHVVEDPPVCRDCERWGPEPLEDDGRCTDCATDREAEREWEREAYYAQRLLQAVRDRAANAER